ncbi:MAG: precorrin-3B synthase [Sporichthyaceae bacterium]
MTAPATRRSGPDLCPGVRSVWSAADGGLARVRIPGGRLSAEQLRLLADAADELGNGTLEITVRANVQVRGLRPAGEHELAARLRTGGLLPSETHDRVRNILGSPLTGLPGRGDVADLIEALDEGLCDRPRLEALPGRFLFAIDDGSADVAALAPDVGVIAVGGPVRAVDRTAVGGGVAVLDESFALLLGARPVGRWVTREEVVPVLLAAAEAFLDERGSQCSPAWRLAELADGPSRVLARIGLPPARAGTPPPALDVPCIPSGAVPLADGTYVAVVEVAEGRLSSARARELAAAAPELRVTPWRSVVLRTSDEASAIAHSRSDVTGREC